MPNNGENYSVLEKDRLYSLDFVKFLLAVVIVFHHFQQIMEIKFSHFNFFYGRIYFGYAVEFFFIISGFVLSYQDEAKKLHCFRSWMLRKMSRILPMASLSIFACVPILFIRHIKCSDWNSMPGLWNLATSLTCIFAGGGIQLTNLGVNNPLWYVSVLFICYVFFFAYNRISAKIGIKVHYFYILMVLVGMGVHYYEIEFPFFNSLSCRGYVGFFLGILLYEFYSSCKSLNKLFVVAFIVAICSAGSIFFGKMADDKWAILTFLLFPSVLFVFLRLNSFFLSGIFSVVGALSFEMYLWHYPFILLYKTVRELSKANSVVSRNEMLLFTVALVILCIPIYFLVEKRISYFVKSKVLML